MASGYYDFWCGYYYRGLRKIFGNMKNYRRWKEDRKLENWNNWLISLGYREEKL